uniref:Uncharacterized protein n=1 Tax=Knipowitschia caucasica TaxID=637954 RepID=A0AAV2KQ18_KNICA
MAYTASPAHLTNSATVPEVSRLGESPCPGMWLDTVGQQGLGQEQTWPSLYRALTASPPRLAIPSVSPSPSHALSTQVPPSAVVRWVLRRPPGGGNGARHRHPYRSTVSRLPRACPP